jgi:tRNA-dihydrouridine synthase B
MAGLTDVPFRTMAWRFGAGYMVSEMVASKPELWETGKSSLRRVPVPGAQPVAIQIAGTDPAQLADAARRHVDEGVQVIDINFGCPVKKVCRKFAGSALLADLPHVGRLVEAVVNAVSVPVTVKTRTGLTPQDSLGVEAGRIAAAAGAQMITMHGRSRQCRFNGQAEYSAVTRLKQLVSVPVLVNGDIGGVDTATNALIATGADGVMIGRAAIGQPWLFARLAGRPEPDEDARWQTVVEHVALMHEFYGASAGVRIARKHIGAYLQHLDPSGEHRSINQIGDASQQLQWLRERARRRCGQSIEVAA